MSLVSQTTNIKEKYLKLFMKMKMTELHQLRLPVEK